MIGRAGDKGSTGMTGQKGAPGIELHLTLQITSEMSEVLQLIS